MGTHPIFESDFDCLTDQFRNESVYPAVASVTLSLAAMPTPLRRSSFCRGLLAVWPPISRRNSRPSQYWHKSINLCALNLLVMGAPDHQCELGHQLTSCNEMLPMPVIVWNNSTLIRPI